MMHFHQLFLIGGCLSAMVACRSDSEDTRYGSSSRSLEALQSAIDDYVQNVMSYKQIPGLSLAVVNGDSDQLTKGYGVRKLGTEDFVTEDTLFYIASTTKAITASVLLQTLLKNNISLDRPVKDLLPEFQVAEYYRQERATVGDLLSHRMGIPESLYFWLLGEVTTSRLDIVKRALYFKPSLSFRDSHYYSNLFYQAAGLVTEALSGGQLWETVVRKTVFEPLGMDDTSFMDQLTEEQQSRLVTPHEPDWRNNNVMREVSLEFFKHAGLGAPGGDIVSSAKDLVRWLYLLTHGGLNAAGERVLDEQVLEETMSPHAVTWPQDGDEPLSSTSENYGYGWYTGHHKGYRKVNHAGYMFGYHALATVYPGQKIGIFTCSNGQQNGPGGLSDIHDFITDLILNQTTVHTASEARKELSSEVQQLALVSERYRQLDSLVRHVSKQQQATEEFLDQFVGIYGNFAFGNVTVTYNNATGRLKADYGDLMSVDVFHIGADWFVGQPSSVVWFFPPIELKFSRRPEDNAVIAVTVPILLEVDPPVFVRGLTMNEAPEPPTCDC